ncbi:MAG: CBS domain-containing protein [Candidatus Aenigmarchaeota archaeon]|nr:CBS domain-containing protein [Candidatus Aenigmarchaeota archaeon]
MLVKDVMTKKVITTSPDETISQAIAKMRQNKLHQLPVIDDGKLAGIVTINKIIIHESDPSTAKVANIMIRSPTIKPDYSLEEAAELLVNADMRAVPVVDREMIGMISENDILNNVKLSASIDDVMKGCTYVNDNDNAGKVKQLFVRKNLSRVPVMKNGKAIGIVGTMELACLLEGKQKYGGRTSGMKDRGYKEKMNLNEISVMTIMRQPVVMQKTDGMAKALSLLKSNEEVLVENGSLGIITPKDVLKLLHAEKKQAYYQIAGLDDIDDFDVAKIQQACDETIKKLAKMAQLQSMNAKIKTIKQGGGKAQYEIHAQLPTNIGTFVVSRVTNRNVVTAVQEAMKNLEREIIKKYEKIKKADRATRAYMRGK